MTPKGGSGTVGVVKAKPEYNQHRRVAADQGKKPLTWDGPELQRLARALLAWIDASPDNLFLSRFFEVYRTSIGTSVSPAWYSRLQGDMRERVAVDCPEFLEVAAHVKEVQKERIIAGALMRVEVGKHMTERLNPRFAQFLLSANYGLKEVTRTEVIDNPAVDSAFMKRLENNDAKPDDDPERKAPAP